MASSHQTHSSQQFQDQRLCSESTTIASVSIQAKYSTEPDSHNNKCNVTNVIDHYPPTPAQICPSGRTAALCPLLHNFQNQKHDRRGLSPPFIFSFSQGSFLMFSSSRCRWVFFLIPNGTNILYMFMCQY